MAGLKEKCLDAFRSSEKKDEALKLLRKLRSPETIRDSCDVWQGDTLVHHAVRRGWEDVCKLLIEELKC